MRFIKEFLLIITAVIFQSQCPFLHVFDLLAAITFYFVLRYGWIDGVIFAFLGGLVWDSLSGTGMGLKSMSLVGACSVVRFFHAIFFQQHFSTRLGIVCVGTFSCLVLEWFFYVVFDRFQPILLRGVFLTALWNGLWAVIAYPILDRVFREPYGQLAA